jgi:branched-chain amino acid transport system ATP-binding protein
MARPKLLLLDEPSRGRAPHIVVQIFNVIKELDQQGMSILLVEQNARMALAVSDQVLVLSKGTVVFGGSTGEFHRREAELKGRYLSV